MARQATLYRMVTDKHVCPYGLKSKALLEHPAVNRVAQECGKTPAQVRLPAPLCGINPPPACLPACAPPPHPAPQSACLHVQRQPVGIYICSLIRPVWLPNHTSKPLAAPDDDPDVKLFILENRAAVKHAADAVSSDGYIYCTLLRL